MVSVRNWLIVSELFSIKIQPHYATREITVILQLSEALKIFCINLVIIVPYQLAESLKDLHLRFVAET